MTLRLFNYYWLACLLASLIYVANGVGKDADLVCSACRLLTSELLSKVEAEAATGRTVESGSFRVDPSGNQRVSKVPYARSDTHLTNLIESFCHSLDSYGHTSHPNAAGQRGFVRWSRPDGRPVDSARIVSGSGVDNWLRMRCESLVDDYEDELKSLLRRQPALNVEQLQAEFCRSLASVCTESQLTLNFEVPIDEKAEAEAKEAKEAEAKEAKEAEAKEAEAKEAEAKEAEAKEAEAKEDEAKEAKEAEAKEARESEAKDDSKDEL